MSLSVKRLASRAILSVVYFLGALPALAQVTVIDFPAPPYAMGDSYVIEFDYDGSYGAEARLGVLLDMGGGEVLGPIGETLIGDAALTGALLQFSIPSAARGAEGIRLAAYEGKFNDFGISLGGVQQIDFTRDDFPVFRGVTGVFNAGEAFDNGFQLYGGHDRVLITRGVDLSVLPETEWRFTHFRIDDWSGPDNITRLEYSRDGCATFSALDYTSPGNGSSFPDNFLYHASLNSYVVPTPAELRAESEVHFRWMQPAHDGADTQRWQLYNVRLQSDARVDLDTGIDGYAEPDLVTPAALAFTTTTERVSFCRVPVGHNSIARTVTLTNTGTDTMNFGTLALAGDDPAHFAINNDGCSAQDLDALQSCTFDVLFAPTQTGLQAAEIVLEANAVNNPVTLSLGGYGEPAPLGFELSEPTFGDQILGESGMLVLTIGNNGTNSVTLGILAIAGDNADDFGFVENNCDGAELAPGESCSVTLSMMPSESGPRSARLAIPSSAFTGEDVVLLSGAGVFARVQEIPVTGRAGMLALATLLLASGGWRMWRRGRS